MNNPYDELPHQSIDALGIKTSFVTAGTPDGRPIVLLHGMSSSGDIYREMMHELADEFWMIAPDIPGFGYSEKTDPFSLTHLVEWLAAFREALDLSPMILVGHSFGGALVTRYALSYPDDVNRILLIAPALLAAQMLPDFLKKATLSLGLVDLGTAVSQSRAMVKQQIKQSFVAPEKQHPSVWERRLRDYDLARSSAGVLKAVAFERLQAQLDDIHQPVAILWGENDGVLPVSQAFRLGELIPQAQVEIFANCDHQLMLEKQALFQAAARAFFRGEDIHQAVHIQKEVGESYYNGQIISVFGSSAPKPGSTAYEQAKEVGRLLAERGYAVATGGYSGTMAAVSQGAAESGGHVIGVTSDQIELFRPLGPNQWVIEEIRYPSLGERLLHLVMKNDGMIVLPGGIGTISEMTLAWSFLQTGEIGSRPLTLLGNGWLETINSFADPDYILPRHLALIHFADSPESAVDHILNWNNKKETDQ